MLLAIYCLRAPQGPGAWTYVGLAMRIAIDLGLHRKTSTMATPSLPNELRKRLFWSCYNLDRQVSIPLGRPFALSNREIDVPLSLDVDEEADDISALENEFANSNVAVRAKSNSLSLFIQVIKLRMIESRIQEQVYRVDTIVQCSDAEIDAFVAELTHWKSMIPLDVQKRSSHSTAPIDVYENYVSLTPNS